jgi:hypothetical protein
VLMSFFLSTLIFFQPPCLPCNLLNIFDETIVGRLMFIIFISPWSIPKLSNWEVSNMCFMGVVFFTFSCTSTQRSTSFKINQQCKYVKSCVHGIFVKF